MEIFLQSYMKQRLNKFIAASGVCSRRKADEYIAAGKVKVDGVTITTLGQTIDVDAQPTVTLRGKIIPRTTEYIYVMLNKPVGYTVTKADRYAAKLVMELLPKELQHLKPVGRLDRDSEGLLLFTNDGALAQRLTHPSFQHEKEYQVTVRESMTDDDIRRLRHGIILEEGNTGRAAVKKINEHTFTIVLKQGWKRQIRRMAKVIRKHVIQLCRVRIGKLQLGNLKTGQWRYIAKAQVC